MTVELNKREYVRKMYGMYADIALELCDENGWIKKCDYFCYFPQDKEEIQINNQNYCRPKTLRGIEDNNGWTPVDGKIALENGKYMVRLYNPQTNIEIYDVKTVINGQLDYYFATHYRILEEYLPPLY